MGFYDYVFTIGLWGFHDRIQGFSLLDFGFFMIGFWCSVDWILGFQRLNFRDFFDWILRFPQLASLKQNQQDEKYLETVPSQKFIKSTPGIAMALMKVNTLDTLALSIENGRISSILYSIGKRASFTNT